jgi:hypothetical protein
LLANCEIGEIGGVEEDLCFLAVIGSPQDRILSGQRACDDRVWDTDPTMLAGKRLGNFAVCRPGQPENPGAGASTEHRNDLGQRSPQLVATADTLGLAPGAYYFETRLDFNGGAITLDQGTIQMIDTIL